MKLYGSLTSPYVRKVRIFLQEKEIDHEFIVEGPSDPKGNISRLNPLGKVPVLIRDDGEVIFDSPMIIEFLDELTGYPLIPSGKSRWRAQRWHALGQGILEAVVARMMETRRPSERQDPAVIDKQEGKVAAALGFADEHYKNGNHLVDDALTIADISLAVALEYIDFRYAHDWRGLYPRLGKWLEEYSSRPAFIETRPPAA
jgi:glutathione S-transferase